MPKSVIKGHIRHMNIEVLTKQNELFVSANNSLNRVPHALMAPIKLLPSDRFQLRRANVKVPCITIILNKNKNAELEYRHFAVKEEINLML
ncbi:hypothetical protein A4R40_08155 [Photorhabdus laumondii subsp. laumondii]|nr:hypothetical protein A4R40_08155 [Photorhabdus laumondii subsp. laumondii]